MANYFARKAGNIDATDVWATTPSGTAGAQTFVSGDVLYANNFAITVNVSTNLGSAGEVRNDNTNSATAGGTFTLSNGVTLTANVIAGSTSSIACVTYAGTTGNSATIIGNCTGGSATGSRAVTMTGTGTLNITGNCNGGTGNGTNSGSSVAGVANTSSGTVNITGNCTAGSGNWSIGGHNASTGILNITGNCTGGGGAASAHGAENNSTGTINITGNCVGGTNATAYGAQNTSTGILSITGNCTGSSSVAAVGALNASTGQMSVTGSIYATEQASGVGGGVRGQVTRLTGPFYTSATFGVNPNTCLAWRWAATLEPNTFIEVPTTNLTSTRNLVTPDNATNFPSASNVRSGVTFGINGALTGTCAVPPAASVAIGVPVSNTTGSATLSPADFWSYSLSSAAGFANSVGQKLSRAATPADIIALG